MTKYTTVEGHPIVRDGEYETREGDKVKVVYIDEGDGIRPLLVLDGGSTTWYKATGKYINDVEERDLMRPWGEKEKKTYKLSEMYAVWSFGEDGSIKKSNPYRTLDKAREGAKPSLSTSYTVAGAASMFGVVDPVTVKSTDRVVAITRADATEFTEGEGLKDE